MSSVQNDKKAARRGGGAKPAQAKADALPRPSAPPSVEDRAEDLHFATAALAEVLDGFEVRGAAGATDASRAELQVGLELLRNAMPVQGGAASKFADALEGLLVPPAVEEKPAEPLQLPLVTHFGAGAPVSPGSPEERAQLLGGKGANLQEMSAQRLPIPPGFTISTEACAEYLKTHRWPEGLEAQVDLALERIEKKLGKKFGDPAAPLLLSVRSGAAVSMPGMMDTILNLGMNDKVAEGLAKASGNECFAYDSYRRFIGMFASVVMGVNYTRFEQRLEELKSGWGVSKDSDLTADQLKEVVSNFKNTCRRFSGRAFPEDPKEQLRLAVGAVFKSWNGYRAVQYRAINGIEGLLGTAVNVQAMVFGNMGTNSGTGVCFTRDPATGASEIYGEFLVNAQGEDVVAGIRTPLPISEMAKQFPEAFAQLQRYCKRLERRYKDMQDIEFTVEDGKLYILQTRSGKRTGEAALKIAIDLADEKIINRRTAVLERIQPEHITQSLRPRFASAGKEAAAPLVTGEAASPGAAVGQAVFTVDDAVKLNQAGTPVILIRNDTSPEDIGGMDAAQAILTRTGGKTSHAAIVALGWGKPCVTGAGDLRLDERNRCMTTADGTKVNHGDWISLNGSTGEVVRGKRELVTPEPSEDLQTLMGWAERLMTREIRVRAETPTDVKRGLSYGAQAVGLCRTEHMFFSGEALATMQEMLLGLDASERPKALAKLHDGWKENFKALFRAQGQGPVTIRLLSATLDTFLPANDTVLRKVAADMGVLFEDLKVKREALRESEPALGLKGSRLALKYPEITAAQTRAVVAAALEAQEEGIKVTPEILVPMVGSSGEFEHQRQLIAKTAAEVLGDRAGAVKMLVGANIETPRGAFVAGEIAKTADFLCFDTESLTQLTFGFNRDAGDQLNKAYADHGILKGDPYTEFDGQGVGGLVRRAAAEARRASPGISLRLAGNHGTNHSAIAFAVGDGGLDGFATDAGQVFVAKLVAAKAEQAARKPKGS